MGASPDNLDAIADLHGRGLVPRGGAIADLGCTQLRDAAPQDVRRFLKHFGPVAAMEVQRLAQHNTFLCEHMTAAGFRYRSFDVIDAPMCERFDLNSDVVPDNHREAFDLVLNFGTTEHVLNQLNAMRTMHDMARVGGLIYSLFLRGGHMGHGLVHYSDCFVDVLCAANSYRIIAREDQGDACTWAVLQKINDEPFAVPLDVPTDDMHRHGRLRLRTRLRALWEAVGP